LSAKHGIKGYEHSPLDDNRVEDFIHKLNELQRRQNVEVEKIQSSGAAKSEELTKKLGDLRHKQDQSRIERDAAREQVVRGPSYLPFFCANPSPIFFL
jgi:DNA repair protein RAD50